MSLVEQCKLIKLNDFGDERGSLVVIEEEQTVPFSIKRIFYIYGSDSDIVRGQHANRKSEFVLINVKGSSKIRVTDGREEKVFRLDSPMQGLYIPKFVWKDMYGFTKDSVMLVLANTHYDGSEYIRNYDDYAKEMNERKMYD